ncbi:hypothetical protein L2E82_40090 [Cichorium intybus]|uniref:Uncharacterized protein n=1 Tax=Cichorium intybus TaxID=13427 RepID=A0ACB9AJH5_CICIN|nr:hypothetical protein L2E82_40090 [Cichorium intybus]
MTVLLPPALLLQPSVNKFKNFRNLKPSIVSGISPENDWVSNRASTVSPNLNGILPETLVPSQTTLCGAEVVKEEKRQSLAIQALSALILAQLS